MFEDLAFSVGMISWCTWGAVNLAWTVEYAVQTGRARIVSFEWFLLLTGLRAAESGIDNRVFGAIAIVLTLVFAASGLTAVIYGFRSSRFA